MTAVVTSNGRSGREGSAGIYRLMDGVLRPIENAAAGIGGVMMLVAMVLMVADAVMRYLFKSPIEIASRLIEHYLLVAMFAMPLAWGFRTGGYIRIVAAVEMLPTALKNFTLRAGLLASSAYVGALAWTSGAHFLEVWRSGEVYVGVIDWSVAWSWIWVPVGLGLLAARLVLIAFGGTEDLTLKHNEGSSEAS